MSSRIRRLAALGVSVAGLFAFTAAPAAAAVSIPLNNWTVSGSLTIAKLGQTITLPPGGTFNGVFTIEAPPTPSSLTGDILIPQFTANITIFGIPARITTRLVETGPTTLPVVFNADGSVDIHGTSSANLFLVSLGVGPFTIPLGPNCKTSTPVILPLDYHGPPAIATGLTFTGKTTIPNLSGCGFLSGILSLLMSGPNNPFSLTIKPPGV